MERGGDEAEPFRLFRPRFNAERGAEGMVHRLQHAEEHQANPDPGGEQHGDPTGIAVIRLGVGPAETDASQLRESDEQAKDDEQVHRNDEKPVEICCQPGTQFTKKYAGAVLKQQSDNHKCDDDHR